MDCEAVKERSAIASSPVDFADQIVAIGSRNCCEFVSYRQSASSLTECHRFTLKGHDVVRVFNFLRIGLRLAAVPTDAEITTCVTEGKPHSVFMPIESTHQALNEILNPFFHRAASFQCFLIIGPMLYELRLQSVLLIIPLKSN
jgi:hypothetical protein